MVADSVAYLKAHGREVVFDAEHFFDGYRANRDYALARPARGGRGGRRLARPLRHERRLAARARSPRPSPTSSARSACRIGIHAHNDCELAVANTLAAVAAGRDAGAGHDQRLRRARRQRQPVLGRPEPRAQARRRRARAGEQLEPLTELSRYVDDVANLAPNPRLPFVGDGRVRAQGRHPRARGRRRTRGRTSTSIPALVGNRRRVLVSELRGRSNVVERARELGLDARRRRRRAREGGRCEGQGARGREGFQFEDAEASFELLVRRAADGYRRPFEPRAYAVDSRKRRDDDGSRSTASAEVGVGGEVLRGEATGGGPVERAREGVPPRARSRLPPPRACLADRLPRRDRAQPRGDARRRSASGSPAPRREPSAGRRSGSSRDLLHASWLALTDCLEYAILTRAGIAPGHPEPLPDAGRAGRGAGGDPATGARRRGRARCWTRRRDRLDARRRSTSPNAADRAFAAHATALGAALFYSFGNFCAIAAHPRWDSVKRVNLLKGPAGEPGRQRHDDPRPLRAAVRLGAAPGGARPRDACSR